MEGSRKHKIIPDQSLVDAALCAVILAVENDDPKVLTLKNKKRSKLPSGPLQPEHKTLQSGLRSWVERQTGLTLGHIEQLYTFGDYHVYNRVGESNRRSLTIAYLALTRPIRFRTEEMAGFNSSYSFFPWEDWRTGQPKNLDQLMEQLILWCHCTNNDSEREQRKARIQLAFGSWDDEQVLERYELLYEAALVPEAWKDRGNHCPDELLSTTGYPLAIDHRRILATALSRLRAKIKYRPVLFELMPAEFTLLQLQRTVEAISGVTVHKQNFRRLVEKQGLIEETGNTSTEAGGRPAKIVRFRPEAMLERSSPGVRIRSSLSHNLSR